MSPLAISLVLLAAVLHACWNAMVKAVADRAAVLAAVSAAHALAGLVLIAMAPAPAVASWPSIVISTVVHYGSYILLFHAYRLGEFSQVYPISRGLAPMVVAVGAAILIGETLTPTEWAGLIAISLGIGFLALQRGAIRAPPATILIALALGCTIATYSVADGIGVRLSGSPLGYMGWLFLCEAPVPMAIAIRRLHRGGNFDPRVLGLGLAGGVFALTAYGLVLYVKTFAPLGAVSAVRESSVVIAALIGVIAFHERPWRGRIAAAVVVAGGVIALALAGA